MKFLIEFSRNAKRSWTLNKSMWINNEKITLGNGKKIWLFSINWVRPRRENELKSDKNRRILLCTFMPFLLFIICCLFTTQLTSIIDDFFSIYDQPFCYALDNSRSRYSASHWDNRLMMCLCGNIAFLMSTLQVKCLKELTYTHTHIHIHKRTWWRKDE